LNIWKNLLDLSETEEIAEVETLISAHQTTPGFEDPVCIAMKIGLFDKDC